jgi:hypothetical protein
VSYRQLHFWVTKGWIPGLVPNGSGSHLRWTAEQVHTAQQIKARLAVARTIQADPTTPIRGLDSWGRGAAGRRGRQRRATTPTTITGGCAVLGWQAAAIRYREL